MKSPGPKAREVSSAPGGGGGRADGFRVEGLPIDRRARLTVLNVGYSDPGVASTVTLVEDADSVIIVDPGMTRQPSLIPRILARQRIGLREVTDVILSHHHPDHTLHAGLFPAAQVHDYWAIYRRDEWHSRPAEGFRVSPSVRLLATPGHTPQDITTAVGTKSELVALTHLWWDRTGPPSDPLATDPRDLHRGRRRVLAWATQIIPGHGAPFQPGSDTPR